MLPKVVTVASVTRLRAPRTAVGDRLATTVAPPMVPGGPVIPCAPVGPVTLAPATPVGPTPRTPVGPVGPMTVAPVFPVGPVGPPNAPVDPVGPCTTTTGWAAILAGSESMTGIKSPYGGGKVTPRLTM